MSAAPTPTPGGGKTDLLMRFFESDFFDSWICLTYLYKSQSQGVLDYLCNRLYTLPEKDVEKYLSQLCHFVYARPSISLERVLVDLCAQSLRIAVKTYWLLLAISQDQPRNKHIAILRDRCEQAALEGYWDLPFKETKLPPISPLHQRAGLQLGQLLSPSSKNGQRFRSDRFGSPDPFQLGRSRPMSPEPFRPMSPDGLGGGLYSSVFVDTGVEGLIQPSPVNLRQIRQHVISPKSSESNLPSLQTPSRRPESERMKSLKLELGVGGASGKALSDDAEIASPPFSPPNSPRRRQTTFGATLDFIDALCTASSGLTAFQPEDRDWALHKVLQNINVQVEKASKTGVAIWFPMGDTNLRVVRLAARESTLLNSREKAPFTLHVEVLDEELRTVVESIAADLAASTHTSAEITFSRASTRGASISGEMSGSDSNVSFGMAGGGSPGADQHAESMHGEQLGAEQALALPVNTDGIVQQQQQEQPRISVSDDPGHAFASFGASNTGEGETRVNGNALHRRTPSIETTSSSVAAAALAAVRGSSAGDEGAAVQDTGVNGSRSPSTISGTSLHSIGESPRTSTPFSSPKDPAEAPQQEGSMQRQQANDSHGFDAKAVDLATGLSSKQSHGSSRSGWSSPTLAPDPSFSDFAQEQSPPRPRSLSVDLEAVSNSAAQAGPSPGAVVHRVPNAPSHSVSKLAGGGTWIGGSLKHGGAYHLQPAAASPATLVSGLSTALAGLRGEAPLVLVKFEILNDTPVVASCIPDSASRHLPQQFPRGKPSAGSFNEGAECSSRDDGSSSCDGGGRFGGSEMGSQQHQRWQSNAEAGAGPGSNVLANRQCSKSGWACKLGLCKLCSGKQVSGSAEVVQPQPYIKVQFIVQGGVDLTIKRTPPRHQRVPSHEAILKVAKQHKVPIPPNTLPPPLPPSSKPQQQPQPRPQQPQLGSVRLKADASLRQPQVMPLAEQQAKTSVLGSPASKTLQRSATTFKPSQSGNVLQQQVTCAAAFPARADLDHDVSRPGHADASSSCGQHSAGGQVPVSEHSSPDQATLEQKKNAEAIYGERWAVKRSRVQQETPHGRRPGWDLRCVIVKSGDDCRQELLAMQLIQAFFDIFQEAQLPLWLRPYEVLVTSNRTALIEMVPNAPSIHSIKAKSAPNISLREHFDAKYIQGTPGFAKAQRNFVESLAAYSLVCYLLQIRDRHNGNILLDDSGHIIHIDFGFMLSNSPGGVNFESAPFKLTRELLEVMDSNSDGKPSELFDYFKVLMIQGFLAVRKHADRITLLVEMMSGSGCPCFKSKVAAVQGLKKRLSLNMPEHQVVEAVLGLISDSLDSWRTRQYDYYQRVLNGIL